MTSPIFTTKNKGKKVKVKRQRLSVFTFYFLLFTFALSIPASAQKVAVLTPDRTESSRNFAETLENELGNKLVVVNRAMSETAFSSSEPDDAFNMTVEQSKATGAAIGCNFFLLVKAKTIRRSSSKRPQYYESHAAIYAVSSRSGRLVFWSLPKYEADKPIDSQILLDDAVNQLASELANKVKAAAKSELTEPSAAELEEPPDEDTPAAKNFRAPIPYRRIKPEYTADAFLYEIKATVEILVDLDAKGSILRTEIVRWAGYGLDESVEKAVRAMNWRPAERNGKTLPMRFLLRYNFKKIEKE